MVQYGTYRPWAASPWVGLESLRRDMDALFDRFLARPVATSEWRGVFPAVNLYEAADAYMLVAELAGVAAGGFDVTLEGSTVVLRGERKIEYATREGTSIHRRERQSGSFRRAFELPAKIDADKIEAVHKNGVLLMRIPKAPESQPRQIPVQGS